MAKAKRYPIKARASLARGTCCGHKLADGEECVPVWYPDETCDAVDGFKPCYVFAAFCPKCADQWRSDGFLFESQAHAEAWLAEQRS